jgi:hypothetical protein
VDSCGCDDPAEWCSRFLERATSATASKHWLTTAAAIFGHRVGPAELDLHYGSTTSSGGLLLPRSGFSRKEKEHAKFNARPYLYLVPIHIHNTRKSIKIKEKIGDKLSHPAVTNPAARQNPIPAYQSNVLGGAGLGAGTSSCTHRPPRRRGLWGLPMAENGGAAGLTHLHAAAGTVISDYPG